MIRDLSPWRFLLPGMAVAVVTGCLSVTGTADNSGWRYSRLRGTVARANGTPVANAPIGISCVGASNEPFGYTAEADASGRFDAELNASDVFAPLEGGGYACRVLTPYVGLVQAEKTILVPFSANRNARPVTDVALVVP